MSEAVITPAMTEVMERLADMSEEEREFIQKSVEVLEELPTRERAFVIAYCEKFNKADAARQAGYSERGGPLAVPRVQTAIARLLAHRESKSDLRAEYIRQYILDVLELCPTDYFVPAMGGGWLIDMETFGTLPHRVKRLIEDVELRQVRGERYFAVKFISKTAALQLAARFTLAQKLDVNLRGKEWDEMANPPDRAVVVEERLLVYERRLQESNGAQAPPVA